MKTRSIFIILVVTFSLCNKINATTWKNVLLPKPKVFELTQGKSLAISQEPIIKMVSDIPEAECGKDEAYVLSINAGKVEIKAITELGVIRAQQTLAQMKLGGCEVPSCVIIDWPALSIRGFMQDIGRVYLPVEEIKTEIDNLAQFKVNVFHWHLTENEAWRLQSDIFPQLNAPENMTRDIGKFYTKAEVREIVDFAYERGMMVVPEIDMPGHSKAFERTMGFSMQSQEGINVLKQLLTEMKDTFGPKVTVFHIGTDETDFTNQDFVPQILTHVRSLGKKVWAWNPGWEFKSGEIDALHLWSYRGEATNGIPAIDSKLHYANHFDTFADIVALYNSRIYRTSDRNQGVAGTCIAFWHDTPQAETMDMVTQNNFYPSVIAAAERAWMGGGFEYFDGHGAVLYDDNSPQTTQFADFEQRMIWHFQNNISSAPVTYVAQCHAKWLITDPFPNEGDLTKTFPPEEEWKNEFVYEGKTYGTTRILGSGVYLRHVWGEKIVKGLYENPEPNHTAYAFTRVFSPIEQDAAMLIEFQNYSRSESKDCCPPQGEWDWKKSWIKLNGKKLSPPIWKEHPIGQITNENCAVRPPTPIHLNEGWNTILIKLPVGEFTTKEIRLIKWMFTAAITTLDGKQALQGITYEP